MELAVVDGLGAAGGKTRVGVEMKRSANMFTGDLWMPFGVPPIDGVSGLAARIVADFDVTLVELHRNVIVVSVV